MTNHVHLLLTPNNQAGDGVSKMMQALGRRYVQYFNYQYQRSGTLWEGRFKSCLVQDERYLLLCYRYIELNPVRARMIESPAEYAWSSYQCNALGKVSIICSPHAQYLALGKTLQLRCQAYKKIFLGHLSPSLINEVRKVTNKGMALGDDRFKQEIEKLIKRKTQCSKAGRPKKICT